MSDVVQFLDTLSEEIRVYRQRQLNTFREVVIVQALVTWGAGSLNAPSESLFALRILAAIACLSVGCLGFWIIILYKQRIYHVRNKRSELSQRHFRIQSVGDSFYDTGRSGRTSTIYGGSLIILALLTALANLLIGLGSTGLPN